MYIIEFGRQAKPSILYVGFVFLAAHWDHYNRYYSRIYNYNLIFRRIYNYSFFGGHKSSHADLFSLRAVNPLMWTFLLGAG